MNFNSNKNYQIFPILIFMMMFVSATFAVNNNLTNGAPVNSEIMVLESFLDSLIQAKMEQNHISGVQFIMAKGGKNSFERNTFLFSE